MATLSVKVCDECGKQGTSMDTWMVLEGIEVRSAKTGRSVISSNTGVDLCSPGCLLRYLSKSLEPMMAERVAACQHKGCVGSHESVRAA